MKKAPNPALTLSAQQFRALVQPVIPCASTDYMLPVLNAVHVRTDGKWLVATATDRFRVGVKRVEKYPTDDDPSREWPEFAALIPLKAVRSILATFKPTRGFDPAMTLTVEDGRLAVEAAGAFDLFDSSRFVHTLETGEYPGIESLIRKALDTPDEDRAGVVSFNPAYLADLKASGARGMRLQLGPPGKPAMFTDDEGFLVLLMPRPLNTPSESWDDLFADEKKSEAAA